MEFSIFYAWQSDSPRGTNLNFIQDATEKAIKLLVKDATLELSPRLDRDTTNLPGTPAIADTILERIKASAMIIADVTLVGMVGTTVRVADLLGSWIANCFSAELTVQEVSHSKKSPNPNVLIEVGNAADAIGWDRVLLVMNTKYGEPQELPFDLLHRRFPIRYSLAPDASAEMRQDAKKALTDDLKEAITTAHEAEYQLAKMAIARLDVFSLVVIVTFGHLKFFRDLGQDAGLQDELKYVITVQQFHAATIRLLDLDLIRTDVQGQNYAYHWTYLGKIVVANVKPPKVIPGERPGKQ